VLEQAGEPATGASGNIAGGMLRPLPSADDNRLSRLTRAGFLATRALLGRLPEAAGRPAAYCTWGANHSTKRSSDAPSSNWAGRLKSCSSSSAKPLPTARLAGRHRRLVVSEWRLGAALVALPRRAGGLSRAPHGSLTRRSIACSKPPTAGRLAADGSVLADAPVVVMASGHAAPRFAQFAWLPQAPRAARSAICQPAPRRRSTWWSASSATPCRPSTACA
jgi:tRNA 5-methylaminomethyl-2-thiouridine biosynthesis bifunctional protein